MTVKRLSEEKPISWQIPYCSFIIIVVCLFVMLSSYATHKRGKIIEIRRSFQNALSEMQFGLLFSKMRKEDTRQSGTLMYMQERIAVPIQKYFKGKGLEHDVFLKSTKDFVSLTILDAVLFKEGTIDLSDQAKQNLKDFTKILNNFNVPIIIEGHTDDQTVKNSKFTSNWQFSALKAIAVMNYFERECGISLERLTAYGFAQYRPFVPNTTDEERRRNRRIEILIPFDKEIIEQKGGLIKETPPSFKIWNLSS